MSSQAQHADFGTGDGQLVMAYKREGDVTLPVKIAKAFLWIASWGVTIWWFSLWFRMPSDEGKAFKKEVAAEVMSPFWGKYGNSIHPEITHCR